MKHKFAVGDKVMIRSSKTSSIGCKEHAGEIVTIKDLCCFTKAYELEELDGYWTEGCLKKVACN